MKNKQIKTPISLKQILLFSGLIIFVLGIVTYIVAKYTYDDADRNARESIFSNNRQLAAVTENAIDEVVNSSYLLFEAEEKIKDKSQGQLLVNSFFASNENVIFILSSSTGLKINSKTDVTDKLGSAKFEKPAKSKVEFKNFSDVIGIPSLLVSYTYGNENALKYGYVCIKTDYLAGNMNGMSFILDKDSNILINSDYSDKRNTFDIAKDYISEIEKSSLENTMKFVKDKNKDNEYFICVHKMKNDVYAVSIIFAKHIF